MASKKKVGIIGAGPSGLGAAYELLTRNKNGLSVFIYDKNDIVGGLARSYKFHGHYFDIGPHRFFTKNDQVLNLWKKILKKDFIKVNRLTRIYYKNKIFYYPIRIRDVLVKLGLKTDLEILGSYINSKIFSQKEDPKTFEQAITKDFGRRLYRIFFKTYSEKVWGISCDQISAKWASQRIKNLNFIGVLKTAVLGDRAKRAKSLVEKFHYTTRGTGFLYIKMAQFINNRQGKIYLNTAVTKIHHQKNTITSIQYSNGKTDTQEVDYLFSSMPLTDFIKSLDPKPDNKILQAANKLIYRDHITVNLVAKGNNLFPDNWVYIHSNDLQMARVTNYNNFYPPSVNKKMKTSAIAVEYFAFKKDRLWKMSDKELIDLAVAELVQAKFINSEKEIIDGFVLKEADSYPAYYMGYEKSFDLLKNYVERFGNLQLIGRGGMYKYDNM